MGGRPLAVSTILKPPPPSPALQRALLGLRPVRTRRPWRTVAAVAAASLVWVGAWLGVEGFRPGLLSRTGTGLVVAASLALAAFFWLLSSALVPPAGDVLSLGVAGPWPGRALAVWAMFSALGVAVALALVGLGGGLSPFWQPASVCLASGVIAMLGPAVFSFWSMRRLLVVSGTRLALALGTSTGALTACFLALHCASPDPRHVFFVHGTLVFAPIGAAWLFHRLRRPRRPPELPPSS